MKHSEQINEIAKAMSNLQDEVKDAEKDTQAYGYKYADLAQVLGLVRPLLKKNGLSFSQHISSTGENVIIETILMHESGQWMASDLCMPVTMEAKRSAAQCVGIAITYGRRYALTGIFGITQVAEDQDGHIDKPEPRKPPIQGDWAANAGIKPSTEQSKSAFVNPSQVMTLSQLIFEAKITQEDFCKYAKIATLGQLTIDRFDGACKWVKDQKKDDKSKYMTV